MRIFKLFDKVVIKTVYQLIDEGWERVPWGYLRNRSPCIDAEISYYNGIEKVLREDRVLTVAQDDGARRYIHCVETNYHVARAVIAAMIPRCPVDETSVLAKVAG